MSARCAPTLIVRNRRDGRIGQTCLSAIVDHDGQTVLFAKVDGEGRRNLDHKEGTSMSRQVKLPGPEHQISIAPSADRVVVRSGETTIADSQSTLVLREANHPPVRYIPLDDVDRSLLAPSDLTTYCPYKGDASYYSIIADPQGGTDAVWFYDQPYPAVAEIKDHVAFYADRVDLTASVPGTLED